MFNGQWNFCFLLFVKALNLIYCKLNDNNSSGNFGYFSEANQRQYAIGSPRGTSDTYGDGNELRRTGQVYITQTGETNDFEYIQTISPRGKIESFIFLLLSLIYLIS